MIVCFIYESVEWKRNLEQNIIGFLSLPWLASEKLGYDLEFHKLCIMPKTACSQWRTHIISKW